MVMHPKTTWGVGFALAATVLVIAPGFADAREALIPPRLIPASFIEARANKAECIVQPAILATMKADQALLGGRTVALIDGADQGFADQWRMLTESDSVDVSLVLAHGFANPLTGEVLIDVVEFDVSGCAFSRTLLTSESWNTIVNGVAQGVSI
jgi:hypothetical protein